MCNQERNEMGRWIESPSVDSSRRPDPPHNCYEWAVPYEFNDDGRDYHGYECAKCRRFIEAS